MIYSKNEKLLNLLKNEVSNGIRHVISGRTLIKKGKKLTPERLKSYNLERFSQEDQWVENDNTWKKIKAIIANNRKKLTLAEQALSDKVWIQLNPLGQEILCIEMTDGRIAKQIIDRDKIGRFKVVPLVRKGN
tara:strand:+ start:163 stop:561 length:399 start_codon:yes stop_codon:yes gene_type:complete